MTGGRLTYSMEEAAKILGVGRTTVYDLVRMGRLRTLKIGSRRLVARVDLEEFVAAQREAA